MGKSKKTSIKYRWLALALCFALCIESSPVQVSAMEEGVVIGQDNNDSGTELTNNTDNTDNQDGNNAGNDTNEPGDKENNGSLDDEDDPDNIDGSDGSGDYDDSGNAGNGNNTGDDSDSDMDGNTDDADNQGDGPEDDASEPIPENDADSEIGSGLEPVSESNPGEERKVLIEEAEEAFNNLLAEKPLMALLYHADSYHVRSKADADSTADATLQIGQTLYVKGIKITDDDVWYQVRYWLDGVEGSGYVQSYYLAYSDEDWIAWEAQYLKPVLELGKDYGRSAYGITTYSMITAAVDSSDISAFPASYQSALRSLKNAHSNWIFVPMNTGLDFNTSVSKEMGAKSLVYPNADNKSKGWVGDPCPTEGGWNYATKDAVAYHMDPRNFLTETYIFQFEQLTFNASYHTVSAVQTFLDGTFMKGTLPDDSSGRTYAQAFYEIGKNRKLSPIHLASRVYQEQGQGKSGLISGTYPGYEGYYNFFNVDVSGASDTDKIVKGLTYAKKQGWNTRYKSLEGGAATIGNNYILKYQDTIYLEKFNVDKNSPYGIYEHQYMQNIQAPASESSSTRKMYANAGSLNSAFVFKIPVYNNMFVEAPLESIYLDKTETLLRRPDTVVADTTGLSVAEKEENTATVTLQVSFEPEDTTSDKTIVWTSSNTKIATVKADPADSSKAVVTAVAKGEVTITAKASKAGGKTAKCKVSISAPIYRIEVANLNAEDAAEQTVLLMGQGVNLAAEFWPKDTTSDTQISWSSSDEKIATVRNGRVEAVGKGTAVITAKAAGCEAGYMARHTIVVEGCSVTFMKRDGETVLKKQEVSYGAILSAEDFPKEETVGNSVFVGWYTGANGTGSRFDEATVVHQQNTTLYPYYVEKGKGFYVLPVGDQTYTGAAVKPVVRVFDSVAVTDGNSSMEPIELVLNKDYTVSYKNNKNVNPAGKAVPTVTVKGKGNYTGTQYVYFNIVPKALTDTDITVNDITAAYNGKTIKNAPAVYRNGKKLSKNTHYSVSYPQTGTGAYRTAGIYPVVITGKGGYTGTITVHETITNDVLMSKVSIAKIPNQTYSNALVNKEAGIGITPEALKVTYKKQTLVESTDNGLTGDYTVSYQNNMAVGTAKVTITAVEGSGFTGSKSITYKIVGTSIKKAKVEGLSNREYTASANAAVDIRQEEGAYTLTLNGKVLTESKDGGLTGDYEVSYAKTNKVGTASITFKGINEYTGQLKKTYKITGYNIGLDENGRNDAITMAYYTQDEPDNLKSITTLSDITAPYVKGGSKPTVILYFNGVELTPGKDYAIKYANHNAVTKKETPENKLPKITVTGKGNFKGSVTGLYTITDGQMAKESKLTMTAKDMVYKNKKNACKSSVTLKDCSGSKLAAGKDYDKNLIYSYETATEWMGADGELIHRKAGDVVEPGDIPPAGTVIRVTAYGMGFYAGDGNAEISTTYRIIAADISKAKVTVQTQVYRNGQPVTLTEEDLKITMSGNSEPLIYGVDYTIDSSTYNKNINKGKATVIIRGRGNFGGEKKITFTIKAKTLAW